MLLEHHLKQLKLPTVLREYAAVAATCTKDRSDYPTYLLRLTERDLLDWERKAAERRIKEAGFPVVKTLDTFDFSVLPSINEHLEREFARGEYIDKRENVLLIGNSGTGKTHLACALAIAACAQGRRMHFSTVTALVTQLLECREQQALQRLHRQLERQHLLVLDELGYVPFSKVGAELLFEVVSRPYERTSLMVTTNLPFEEWAEIVGNERMTRVLLDRLTHQVHIIEANGKAIGSNKPKRDLQPQLKNQTQNIVKLDLLTQEGEWINLNPSAALFDRHPPHNSNALNRAISTKSTKPCGEFFRQMGAFVICSKTDSIEKMPGRSAIIVSFC